MRVLALSKKASSIITTTTIIRKQVCAAHKSASNSALENTNFLTFDLILKFERKWVTTDHFSFKYYVLELAKCNVFKIKQITRTRNIQDTQDKFLKLFGFITCAFLNFQIYKGWQRWNALDELKEKD